MPIVKDGRYKYDRSDWPEISFEADKDYLDYLDSLQAMIYGDKSRDIPPSDQKIRIRIPICKVLDEDKSAYDSLCILSKISSLEVEDLNRYTYSLYKCKEEKYLQCNLLNLQCNFLRFTWHNIHILRLICDFSLILFIKSKKTKEKGYSGNERIDSIGRIKDGSKEYKMLKLNKNSFGFLNILNESSNCIKHTRDNPVCDIIIHYMPNTICYPKNNNSEEKNGIAQNVYDLIAGTNMFIASIFNIISIGKK